jgi:hypothetical protein
VQDFRSRIFEDGTDSRLSTFWLCSHVIQVSFAFTLCSSPCFRLSFLPHVFSKSFYADGFFILRSPKKTEMPRLRRWRRISASQRHLGGISMTYRSLTALLAALLTVVFLAGCSSDECGSSGVAPADYDDGSCDCSCHDNQYPKDKLDRGPCVTAEWSDDGAPECSYRWKDGGNDGLDCCTPGCTQRFNEEEKYVGCSPADTTAAPATTAAPE